MLVASDKVDCIKHNNGQQKKNYILTRVHIFKANTHEWTCYPNKKNEHDFEKILFMLCYLFHKDDVLSTLETEYFLPQLLLYNAISA